MTIECEKVGLDYFETAPTIYTATETIRATPDEIFDAFLDADAWVEFAMPIEKVVWTSGFPIEVGSTRDVHMKGDMVAHEEFLAWDHGERMAFRFNQINKGNITAFAEDYKVTDLGDGRCTVEWTMAMGAPGETPKGGIGGTIRNVVMGTMVKRILRNFRKLVESRPAVKDAA